MPINLTKGQKVDLTKGTPGLTKLMVGLGWDVNAFDSGDNFDLDAAAFLLGENGKITRTEDFVFYGNLQHPSGAVEHLGDNLTGEGEAATAAGALDHGLKYLAIMLWGLPWRPSCGKWRFASRCRSSRLCLKTDEKEASS